MHLYFFLCKFAWGRVVSFQGQKVRKDGGTKVKKNHSGGQSEAKLQYSVVAI